MNRAVPRHELLTFREPRPARPCVVIPVLNEGERFAAQLARMEPLLADLDLYVVDGGSTDGCTDPERLAAAGAAARLRLLDGPGLSAQLRAGFAHALAARHPGVVTLDGNGKDGVDAIPSFVRALDAGWDFVQGSRYLPGGHSENTPLDRTLAVRLLHAPLLSLASGVRYTDTTNGFRAFSARFLEDPRVLPFREVFQTYSLHYYLSVRAARLGFRVKELPVTRVYPAQGPVPSKIGGLRGKARIIGQLLAAAGGLYDPR